MKNLNHHTTMFHVKPRKPMSLKKTILICIVVGTFCGLIVGLFIILGSKEQMVERPYVPVVKLLEYAK